MKTDRNARPMSFLENSFLGVGLALVLVSLSSSPGAGRTQADGESQADSSANASETDATLTLTMTVEGQERQVVAQRVSEPREIGYQFFEADSGLGLFAKPDADLAVPKTTPESESGVLDLIRIGGALSEERLETGGERLETSHPLSLAEVNVCDRAVFADPSSSPEVPLSLMRVGDFYQGPFNTYDFATVNWKSNELRVLLPTREDRAKVPSLFGYGAGADLTRTSSLACFSMWKGRPSILVSGTQAEVTAVLDAFTGALIEVLDWGFSTYGSHSTDADQFIFSAQLGGLVRIRLDGSRAAQVFPFIDPWTVENWTPVGLSDGVLDFWVRYRSADLVPPSRIVRYHLDTATGTLTETQRIEVMGWVYLFEVDHFDVQGAPRRLMRVVSFKEVGSDPIVFMAFYDLETGEELAALSTPAAWFRDAALVPAPARSQAQPMQVRPKPPKVAEYDLYLISGKPRALWHATLPARR